VVVSVPTELSLDFGASVDLACGLRDGAFVALPAGAQVRPQAGRFFWLVDSEHVLPATLVFVIGARRLVVEVYAA